MTEEEWLTTSKPHVLVWARENALSDRRRLLLACAFCRTCWDNLPQQIARDAVVVAENYADQSASDADMDSVLVSLRGSSHTYTANAEGHALGVVDGTVRDRGKWDKHRLGRILQVHRQKQDRELLSQVVRDVIGNPFRPVALDPAWRTSAAIGVAQQMYDARDFAAMPILADALQDAGCEDADILAHCRDPRQVHVRGCWVVDLVLNKS